MKKILSILCFCFALVLGFAEINIKTSFQGDIIKQGSEVKFEASDYPENSNFELKANGKNIQRGKYTESVSFTAEEPAWIFFSVTAPKKDLSDKNEKPEKKEMGFIVAPEKIKVATDRPADLDKFWAKIKTDVEKTVPNPKLTHVKDFPASEGKHEVSLYKFEVKVDKSEIGSCGGIFAEGYIAVPTDIEKAKLPAVVTFYGAGSYSADMRDALNYAQDGAIGVSMNPHAVPADLTNKEEREEFIKAKIHGDAGNYRNRGIKDEPKDVYFVGMFKRCYQTLRMVMARKDWDGKNIAVRGFSQGGAQTIAAAYLCPKVNVISPLCPAMCDNGAEKIGRRSGWPDWVHNANHELEATNGAYFDPAHMATNIKAKMYLGMGLIDNTCSPTALMAMYNNYLGKKQILRMQLIGHGWNDEWKNSEREFILKNIGIKN